ncbi:MAG: Grx4 family monothiol glutaredoxin [Alphaproteobacteria bacterium]
MTNTAMEQIKKDVTENKVVLYMKGTPIFPQCGFSSLAAQIMEHCGCEYKAINVLDDMAVREAIKEYSDWPTIPQLYIDGEFIGGCDIMKEMFEEGELQEILKV